MFNIMAGAIASQRAFIPPVGGSPKLEWKFDDTANMFQDAAGTVPVTAASQPVNHVVSTGTDARPLTQTITAAQVFWDGVDAVSYGVAGDYVKTGNIFDAVTLSNLRSTATFRLSASNRQQAVWSFNPATGNGEFFIGLRSNAQVYISVRNAAATQIARVDPAIFLVANQDYTYDLSVHDGVLDLDVIGNGTTESVTGVTFDISGIDWYAADSNFTLGQILNNGATGSSFFNAKMKSVSLDDFA